MTLMAYLDASGSSLDPKAKVVSVGGFVGHEAQWADYEHQWARVLQAFGVSGLHMRDYAHSRRDFDGWDRDQPKRAAFIGALGKVIRNTDLVPVGASLVLGVYRMFNRDYCLEEAIGSPYTMAAMGAVARGVDWRDRNRPSEGISFFVEQGDNQQDDFRRHLSRVFHDPGDSYLAAPIFVRKRRVDGNAAVTSVLPFQACDFIAYEYGKALTDFLLQRKTQARRSVLAAVKPTEEMPDGRTHWAVMEKRSFGKFMESFHVPKRFNHFRNRPRGKPRPIDPVCYVGAEPVVSYLYGDGYLKDEP